jgi:hypothetical protein
VGSNDHDHPDFSNILIEPGAQRIEFLVKRGKRLLLGPYRRET